MNRIFCCALLAILIVTGTTSASAFLGENDSPWENKLPFKEGTITYTISGTENGSQIAYIKDHGRAIARYRNSSVKMFGFSQTQETIQITTPEFIYNIDVKEGSGTKTVNPQKYMIEEYNKLSSSDKKKVNNNAEKTGTQMMNGTQVQLEPSSAKILGYDCDVVTVSGGKTYTFQGTSVELKTNYDNMGMKIHTEATKVSKGSVPSEKFSPPAGIAIEYDQRSEKMYRDMARDIMANLVEGKPMTASSGSQYSGSSASANRPPQAPPKADAPANAQPEEGEGLELEKMMKGLKGLFGK